MKHKVADKVADKVAHTTKSTSTWHSKTSTLKDP